MNIIELLKDQVTSKVLQGDNHFQDEKIGALSAFYPILLTILKSKPELIQTLQQNLNPRLGDVFSNHFESVSKFIGLVGGDAPSHEIEKTLNHSIAPALSLLADQAGSDDKNVIFNFIKSQWGNIEAALPAWATGFFSMLGLSVGGLGFGSQAAASSVVQPVVTPPRTTQAAIDSEPKKSNWLWPIIALLVLAALAALFLKQCSNKTPVASGAISTDNATQPAVELQAAELHIATDTEGKLSNCQASSSSQSLLDKLKSSVTAIFNQADQCQSVVNAAYAGDLTDQNALDHVLTKIKGIPNASVAWIDNQLTISAPNLAHAQKFADEIKGLVPNLQVTANQTAGTSGDSTASVDTSNTQANQALSNIKTDKANVDDVVSALNLQVINFATGSAHIPDSNKVILDKAAILLKQLPDAKLVVKGFTDNVGNADLNKNLSEKRAKSVVVYLIEKGATPSQLTAEGHGQDNPIADNSTKEGQFKNRRIEFAVSN